MSFSGRREIDPACKVYVGNLLNNVSSHELESAFAKYGPVRSVWVARNPPGFAFVEFEDPRDAEDSVRALDSTRLCGSRVRVEMSTGRSGGGSRYGGGGGYGRGRSRSYSPRRSPRRSRSYSPRRRSHSPPPRRRSRSPRDSRSRSRSPRR